MLLASNYPGQNFFTYGPTEAGMALLAPLALFGLYQLVRTLLYRPAAVVKFVKALSPGLFWLLGAAAAITLGAAAISFFDMPPR